MTAADTAVTRPRCSVVAEAAGDPMEGTAPPVEQWFLLEHPGPWGRVPVTQSDLDPGAVTALLGWARRTTGRVLLIRRPHRSGRAPVARSWFRVDSRPGQEAVRTGTFTAERELSAAVGSVGDPYDGTLSLVCAHGRHDTCCAVRGRPLAAALAAADAAGTWECSHLGGCRFAPALVLLPHGFVFGGVPAMEAPALVNDYRAGVLGSAVRLRGRTCYPPVVQAAQHHARAITGVAKIDALHAVAATLIEPSRWRVTLADPDCEVELSERHIATGRPLTCAATLPGDMRVFDLVAFATG